MSQSEQFGTTTLAGWLARFRALITKREDGRLQEEVEHHLDLLAGEYIRQGMKQSEARMAARRELGNLTLLHQNYREQRGIPVIENLWRDLKFAVRTLRQSPAYTLSCAVTLAVGLGSMITVLCVVSALIWKPLPYPNANRLVAIKELDPQKADWTFSEPDLLDLSERSKAIESVGAFERGTSALTGVGEPETVRSAVMTPSCFALFGVRPIMGSMFRNSPTEVVISRGLWKRKWQMNPGVIGKAVALDGKTHTVAGVADLPEDVLPGAEVVMPLVPSATESRSAHEIEAFGRMRTGVEIGQAQAEIDGVARSIAQENPRTNAGWGMRLARISDYVTTPRTGRTVKMIFAAVAVLWLLACANVAGLQMARGIARRHEMSTRMALGASRLRLFGQTVTESLVLAVLGSAAGLIGSYYAVEVIRSLGAQSLPRLAAVQVDAKTIALALGCVLVSVLLCAIFAGKPPAFQGSREMATRDRGRDLLIVGQVALASVLLLATSLLLHSFTRLRAVDPGFDPERLLSIHVSLPTPTDDDARRVTFFREAIERLERLPEVETIGATNVSPFSGTGTANRFRLDGEPISAEYRSAGWRAVTPEFFTAMGVPLKHGRLFDNSDRNGSLEVVIISESMARRFWPDQDPVGKRLLWGKSGNPKTIVGVVGDLRDVALDTPVEPMMFRPFAQLPDAPMALVARTKGNPINAIRDIRGAIWAIDRNTALEFRPVRDAMADSLQRPRVSLIVLATFAAIALITAALGLYGLISYRVNQRQQEIGVRLALGCPANAVRWNVQKRCLVLVVSGLAIGLPAGYALSSLMSSLLYQTVPTQSSAYLMTLVAFVLVSLAASYGPASRASRLDPCAAMRHE